MPESKIRPQFEEVQVEIKTLDYRRQEDSSNSSIRNRKAIFFKMRVVAIC